MYCLYFHKKKTNGEIFYVGIGDTKRPQSKDGRNKWWLNTVKKHGYDVQVVKENMTWEQACTVERFWIKTIGRKDMKEGTLVNMTNGGDGYTGSHNRVSPMKGKTQTQESKDKISKSKMGQPSYWKGKKRKPVSEETKQKLREQAIKQWRKQHDND